MLRRSLTRAMFRQALAASEACTPTDAPWTLPFGFAGESACLRPGSWSTSWLAASEIASPIDLGRDAVGQGFGDRLGRLLPARRVDRVAQPLDPGVVGLAVPGRAARQALASSSLGSSARSASSPSLLCLRSARSSSTQNRTDWRSRV